MSDSSHHNHRSNAPGSHHQPALSAVLAIVILFVVATFFMLRYSPASSFAANTSTTSPFSSSTSTTQPHSKVGPKSQVRVQVANGTSTPGLARTYTQRLLTLGWDTLPQLNSNKVTLTIVYYNPGYKWAAQQIASDIHAGTHAVQLYNAQSLGFTVHTDDVILILGPDLAIVG
jgi:hypothetical protein